MIANHKNNSYNSVQKYTKINLKKYVCVRLYIRHMLSTNYYNSNIICK